MPSGPVRCKATSIQRRSTSVFRWLPVMVRIIGSDSMNFTWHWSQ